MSAKRKNATSGTDGAPKPVSTISKDDATQECWCGVCGQRTKPGRRFLAGHDQRAKGIIKRAVRAGEVESLTDRQREYADERGLIRETEQQMEREDRKRKAEAAAKAERQREKEGEAERETK